MPVDTSIYSNQAKPINPLATFGSIANTANALNQNRLFQQTFAARKAIGQAYQNAINPATGQLDTNKLLGSVAADPNAGFMAGDVAAQALARKQAELGIQKDQLDLANKHLANMNNRIGSLLAMPNVTPKAVISSVGDAIAEGAITPKIAAQELSSMPSDPGQLKTWLTEHLIRNLDAQQKVQALYGQIQPVDTGGQVNVLAVSPMIGARSLGTVQKTMAPGDAATPVPAFNPQTNQPVLLSKQQFANKTGVGAPAGQSGEIPAAGGIPAGPPLGAQAAAEVTGKESAQQGIDLQQAADAVPQKKAILGNLDAALGNFTSGAAADWKLIGKKFANAANPFGDTFNAKTIASQEEFNKQATMLAQQQFQTLGGTGTDMKLGSTMHTSPNELLSNLGNHEIIALLKGNEDAIRAKNEAWQNWQQTHGSQSYGQFQTEFNKEYDPRVFQAQYLDAEGKKSLLSGMTKTEQTQFRNAYNTAVEKGWIPDPRGTANGG